MNCQLKLNSIQYNNSSLLTAENSSTLPTNENKRKNKLTSIDSKYLNVSIFDNPNTNQKTLKNGLLITETDTTSYKRGNDKFKHLGLNKKLYKENYLSTLGSTGYKTQSYKKPKNFNKTSLLPNIIEYTYNKEPPTPDFLKGFGENFKFLTILYYEEQKTEKINNENLLKKNISTAQKSSNEFLRKTNEIKICKYYIDLKKEKENDYIENKKAKLYGFNHMINTINSYRSNLENNFVSKYNEQLKLLDRQIVKERYNEEIQNKKLISLKKDVSFLKSQIQKKEAAKLSIEKWILFQLLVKEGKNPTNLKEKIKSLNNKLIFENTEEFILSITSKENKNLRLIEKYNKIKIDLREMEKEKQILFKELGPLDMNIFKNIEEKKGILNSLKSEYNKLIIIKKNAANAKNAEIQKKLKIKKNKKEDKEKSEEVLNIKTYINFIYNFIMSNKINGLKFNEIYIRDINNVNVNSERKNLLKLKIIELTLNFLISSIQDKINKNPKMSQYFRNVYLKIELSRKKAKAKRYKEQEKEKLEDLMRKNEAKTDKIYYLLNKRLDIKPKINSHSVNIKSRKNQTKYNNNEINNFLYDIQDDNNI